LNGEPTGEFAHTPEPTEENLTELAERMKAEDAAVGFAQDPDADRLAIVDEKGTYIGEEYTLVLAAKRILDMVAATSGGGVVVATNLSTSRMIDDLAARYVGVEVVRTAVGEANVVEALKQAGDRGLIGGEGNGGVILPRVCWVRDSLSSMALVLSLLAAEGRPLSEIVADLPHYVMIKKKYDLSAIGGCDAVGPMLEKVKKHYTHERINDSDGIRVDVAEGWVHLRPSNTEPIVRLIAEAKTEAGVGSLISEVAGVVGLG
ncbi:MAG: phosphoglucosamine mutase, partial [Planctomycetes bacterium]|nr:phosphoglucosamine mutase [Planctomycetota bacterium]